MRCHYCVNELAGKQFPTCRGAVGNLIPKGKLDQIGKESFCLFLLIDGIPYIPDTFYYVVYFSVDFL